VIMSAMAWVPMDADGADANEATWRKIWTGIGLTRLGGGSARE
jgi:hypothetical protein